MSRIRKLAALLATALLPGLAHADPVSLIASAISYIAGGKLIAAGLVLLAGAFQSYDARRKARKAAAAARAAYNASLQDRSVSMLQALPALRTVYGRCITGGDMAAILTSDKQSINSKGLAVTKPDAYKYLVLVLAAHQCEAIHEVYLDGEPLGALDASGFPTGGAFFATGKKSGRAVTFTTSYTFDSPISSVLSCTQQVTDYSEFSGYRTEDVSYSVAGSTLTVAGGTTVTAQVVLSSDSASVRVIKYLGTSAQTADAMLMAACPSEWTTNHRLRGLTYLVVRLDLEDTRFQGAPPNITADVSGKRVYDPRNSTTAWSANPALCIRDFLLSKEGYGLSASDVDDATIIAAANVCDTSVQHRVFGWSQQYFNAPLYSCNGAVSTDADPEAVLEELAQSMAGDAVYGAKWEVYAGAWVAPVMTLNDDDLMGQIEIAQVAAGLDELFNGVRASYIELGHAVPSDLSPPYQNTTYVTADGAELWIDETFPWTSDPWVARQLCRIKCERARSSMVIHYPAKLKAWPLKVNDRVQVNSTEYGWTNKTFRVTDWQFSLTGAVMLTLQEDTSSMYDLADDANAAPTATTNLPSPNVVAAPSGLTATSGAANVLTQKDGTQIARVKVAWNAATDPYIIDGGGHIEVRWLSGSGEWQYVNATGGDTSAYLLGVKDGDRLMIEARAINALGVRSDPAIIGHTVTGPTISGVVGGGNMLNNSSFEVDSNSDGLADGWVLYTQGTFGAASASLPAGGAVGGVAQRLSATNLGTADGDVVWIYRDIALTPAMLGRRYMLSAWAKPGAGSPKIRLAIDYLAGGTYTESTGYVVLTPTPGSWTRVFTAHGDTIPTTGVAGAPTAARIYVGFAARSGSAGAADADFDGIQFELGDIATAWAPSAADTLNTNISIGSNGALAGGGGGQVTIGGLGYTGALDATRNTLTYSATAPASPINGDIWVDTSVTPNVVKLRVGGAWQVGANLTTNTNQLTDGAGLGTTATWSGVSGSGKPADDATGGQFLNTDPGCQSSSKWTNFVAGWSVQSVTDGPFGTTAIRSSVAAGNSSAYSNRVPVDANKVYRARWWARKSVGADGVAYMMIAAFDSAGAAISVDGSYWYYPFAGITLNDTWTEYSVLFGAGQSRTIHANARTIAIGMFLGYNTTTGYHEIQGVRLEDVTEAYNASLTALWAGVTGTGKPADNATVGATIGVNLSGQITSGNVGTFVGNEAIGTVQVAADAITTTVSANQGGLVTLTNTTETTLETTGSIDTTVSGSAKPHVVNVAFNFSATNSISESNTVTFRLRQNPSGANTVIKSWAYSFTGTGIKQYTYTEPVQVASPPTGNVSYRLTVQMTSTPNAANDMDIFDSTITATGYKR